MIAAKVSMIASSVRVSLADLNGYLEASKLLRRVVLCGGAVWLYESAHKP